jgi:hypothetical protein
MQNLTEWWNLFSCVNCKHDNDKRQSISDQIYDMKRRNRMIQEIDWANDITEPNNDIHIRKKGQLCDLLLKLKLSKFFG